MADCTRCNTLAEVLRQIHGNLDKGTGMHPRVVKEFRMVIDRVLIHRDRTGKIDA